jgi:hypothetical protein
MSNKEELLHDSNPQMISKRHRSSSSRNSPDIIADKENFHRAKALAPRSRPAKVLMELLIDLPTDCSDFEISDCEDSIPTSSVLFNQISQRMSGTKNDHYEFQVYEDPF